MSYGIHDPITKIPSHSISLSSNKNKLNSLLVAQNSGNMQMAASITTAPDLSLHISPPSPPDGRNSVEGEACHETVFNDEPNLCLGLDTATDMAHQDTVHSGLRDIQQQRLHQPGQIQRFKTSSSGSQTLSGGAMRSGNGSSGGKVRSSRAPRMRWTTVLHAHFVHAVELLGGHESMFVLVTNHANVFN
jgi:hypothetical protein